MNQPPPPLPSQFLPPPPPLPSQFLPPPPPPNPTLPTTSPRPDATFHSSYLHNLPPSLPAALSSLSSLVDISTATLNSLPITSAAITTLLPCPFNATHRVPPSSLFSHYLRCSSIQSLSHPLRYPQTLHAPPTSAISFSSSSSDLYFSLESYLDYTSSANNFFYQNCPGPVILHNNDRTTPPPPSLTLPRLLYVEGANFSKDDCNLKPKVFPVDNIKLLPSEIWAIQNEMEEWSARGFPAAYSFRVLRAILRLQDCLLSRFDEWLVANSPKFGIIIDFSIRDHMLRLVNPCLKAIIREAFGLAGFMFCNEESDLEDKVLMHLNNQRFECPVLLDVLMWLASQFGILYGEVSGKLFVLEVFRKCISESSINASFFPLEGEGPKTSGIDGFVCELEENVVSGVSVDNRSGSHVHRSEGQTVGSAVVFVSQMLAAVAALHERSMLERNIRAARDLHQLSGYQRNAQHESAAKVADEVRQQRSDYRPMIEHDGFLWQRSHGQGSNKVKTREELLAEERDYKRRRMSYRGKKLKRNTTEIMRDIIEEYMEEMKQAGRTDNMAKAVDKTENTSEDLRNCQSSSGFKRKTKDNKCDSLGNNNSPDILDGVQPRKQGSSQHNNLRDFDGSASRIAYDRDDYSRTLDGKHNSYHSLEQVNHNKKTDDVEVFREDSSTRSYNSRTSREHISYKRKRDEGRRYSYEKERDENWDHRDRRRNKTTRDPGGSEKTIDRHRDRGKNRNIRDYRDIEDIDVHYSKGRSRVQTDRYNDDEGHAKRSRSKSDRDDSSHSTIYNEFEDRYDPAKSHDSFDDI